MKTLTAFGLAATALAAGTAATTTASAAPAACAIAYHHPIVRHIVHPVVYRRDYGYAPRPIVAAYEAPPVVGVAPAYYGPAYEPVAYYPAPYHGYGWRGWGYRDHDGWRGGEHREWRDGDRDHRHFEWPDHGNGGGHDGRGRS